MGAGGLWPADGSAPWEDAVDARLDHAFLARELERGRRAERTPDCRDGICSACGVCGGDVRMEVLG